MIANGVREVGVNSGPVYQEHVQLVHLLVPRGADVMGAGCWPHAIRMIRESEVD
jgi:hypothetical protein